MKNVQPITMSALSLVCLSALSIGCGPEASVPPPVVPTTYPEPTVTSPEPTVSELHEQAEKVRARVIAVQKQMNATIKSNPDTEGEIKRWAGCMATTCRDEFEMSKSVDAMLIRALTPILPLTDRSKPLDDKQVIALESQVSEAEKLSAEAAAKAKRIATGAQTPEDVEPTGPGTKRVNETDGKSEARFEKADTSCKKGTPACKTACEGKEDFAMEACVLYALELSKLPNPDLNRVLGLMKRSCEGKVQVACETVPTVEKAIVGQGKKRGQSMAAVLSEGDDLAAKTYMAKAVESLGGKKRLMAAKAMRAQMAAVVRESFCPAKKEAIASLGQKEFASRVAKHCDEDPPMTQGLSGKQIELKAECKATFSTACP